jgi:hypothetical protein
MGIFFFTTAFRTALGPTQPPIQWVPGTFSLAVNRPGREADHSPPSSAEVKEWVELYFHSPNTPSWRGTQLKHRDNFTFTFTSRNSTGGGGWNSTRVAPDFKSHCFQLYHPVLCVWKVTGSNYIWRNWGFRGFTQSLLVNAWVYVTLD